MYKNGNIFVNCVVFTDLNYFWILFVLIHNKQPNQLPQNRLATRRQPALNQNNTFYKVYNNVKNC